MLYAVSRGVPICRRAHFLHRGGHCGWFDSFLARPLETSTGLVLADLWQIKVLRGYRHGAGNHERTSWWVKAAPGGNDDRLTKLYYFCALRPEWDVAELVNARSSVQLHLQIGKVKTTCLAAQMMVALAAGCYGVEHLGLKYFLVLHFFVAARPFLYSSGQCCNI